MDNGLSIIVPVYNAERYIERCAKSLFSQTISKQIEYIFVVDKNTKDKSEEILRRIVENSDRDVKIIKPQNGTGAGYNRNVGIENITKEFFGFCDADDYMDTNLYGNLYNFADIYNADIAIGQVKMVDDDSNKEVMRVEYTYIKEMTTVGEVYSMIKWNTVWDKIYRTNTFINDKTVRFPEGVVHEDNPFVLNAVYKAKKIITIPGAFYCWARNFNSVTSNNNYAVKRFLDSYTVFKMVLDRIEELDIPVEEKVKVIQLNINTYGIGPLNSTAGDKLKKQIHNITNGLMY